MTHRVETPMGKTFLSRRGETAFTLAPRGASRRVCAFVRRVSRSSLTKRRYRVE